MRDARDAPWAHAGRDERESYRGELATESGNPDSNLRRTSPARASTPNRSRPKTHTDATDAMTTTNELTNKTLAQAIQSQCTVGAAPSARPFRYSVV